MRDATDPTPLPPESVLLHIGPYKTGTTAVQASLAAARPRLGEYDVAYPGTWRRLIGPAYAVMGWAPRGRAIPDISEWDSYAARIRARSGVRICISTEDFSRLRSAERIGTIVSGLGGDRVHVLAAARPLHRLLPSAWQERVKSGDRRTYEEWLRSVLGDDTRDVAYRLFWTPHRLEESAPLWIDHVGVQRYHVMVTDEDHPTRILRVFEGLLGLPEEFLELEPTSNSSLTANATEVVRRLNERFEAAGLPGEIYFRLVQSAFIAALQQTSRAAGDQPIPALPSWAIERTSELTEQRIDALRAMGIQVIGHLDALRIPPDYVAATDTSAPETVSVSAAADGVIAILDAVATSPGAGTHPPVGRHDSDAVRATLNDVRSRDMVAEVLHRQRRRVARARSRWKPADSTSPRPDDFAG